MPFPLFQWDLAALFFINQQGHHPLLNGAMRLFSDTIFLITLGITLTIVAVWRYDVRFAVVLGLGLTLGASNLACDFVKARTDRARPYHSISGTWFVDGGIWKQRPENATPKSGGSSFPSGHSANSAAAALFLFLVFRKKIVWLLPVLLGYSRIYLGKHFPSDVLGGWALGLAVAGILALSYPVLRSRLFSLWMRYRLRE
jgi:membrane-associated phospholipid phosphatase